MSTNIKTYVTGFPRIGEKRELKKALENYWDGKIDLLQLEEISARLRKKHWLLQKEKSIDLISINDFSWYDNMLDTAVMLNAIPSRFRNIKNHTERYFSMAKGNKDCTAMEMTKWFNTNYHYIVPELSKEDRYQTDISKIKDEYRESKTIGIEHPKINIIGPVTFLGLSKHSDKNSDPFVFTDKIADIYKKIIREISFLDEEVYLQIEEPFFVRDLPENILSALPDIYKELSLSAENVRIIFTTYFEHSVEAIRKLSDVPVWGIALDLIHGHNNLNALEYLNNKKLIAGVVNGRNIWINDIDASVKQLEQITTAIPRNQIIISTSCSLLHVPYTTAHEEQIDKKYIDHLSFACEKLDEVNLIAKLFHYQTLSPDEKAMLERYRKSLKERTDISKTSVTEKGENHPLERESPFETRNPIQKKVLGYPLFPTTTIGSFPQTPELRKIRRNYRNGEISQQEYETFIKDYIEHIIEIQEDVGLDILVHGEPERNDMVEYFGELLEGFVFTRNGWVQSYGSRCVKPPVIFGDIRRNAPMTIKWITYAQSKTDKPVKGMLTGPITILNWSFVRDDIPRDLIAEQIALALRKEISDLQKGGIKIIQVDEPAFKEGYPLRKIDIPAYEEFAIRSFKLAVSSATKETQIHTHMCYSEFNDIIHTIEAMDADVITIETARSGNELLQIFKKVNYKNEIGPGIYDIHSPRIPDTDEMINQIKSILEVLPAEKVWVNPDCGLKTRKWKEVIPSLKNMVNAAKIVREEIRHP